MALGKIPVVSGAPCFFLFSAIFVAAHTSFHYGTPSYSCSLLPPPNHSLFLTGAAEERRVAIP